MNNQADPEGVPDDVREFATKLFDLARAGEETLLDYIDHGVDPNLSNQDGNSLLMLAAYAGHARLVEEIAGRNGDVDKQNARGQSPLAGAVFKKEDAVVDVLLAAGADPRAGTPSAIDTARMFGREDLVERMQ